MVFPPRFHSQEVPVCVPFFTWPTWWKIICPTIHNMSWYIVWYIFRLSWAKTYQWQVLLSKQKIWLEIYGPKFSFQTLIVSLTFQDQSQYFRNIFPWSRNLSWFDWKHTCYKFENWNGQGWLWVFKGVVCGGPRIISLVTRASGHEYPQIKVLNEFPLFKYLSTLFHICSIKSHSVSNPPWNLNLSLLCITTSHGTIPSHPHDCPGLTILVENVKCCYISKFNTRASILQHVDAIFRDIINFCVIKMNVLTTLMEFQCRLQLLKFLQV